MGFSEIHGIKAGRFFFRAEIRLYSGRRFSSLPVTTLVSVETDLQICVRRVQESTSRPVSDPAETPGCLSSLLLQDERLQRVLGNHSNRV